MDKQNQALESLARVQSGESLSNYPAIFAGFQSKGIPLNDIKPRENVFKYDAWQALNRQVRKGEKGVRIVTWLENQKTGEKFPRTVSVFHISQTDPIQ